MVLETIDTTQGEHIANQVSKLGNDMTFSPMSADGTEAPSPTNDNAAAPADEARDMANATPCDSIRDYASDLEASKNSGSEDVSAAVEPTAPVSIAVRSQSATSEMREEPEPAAVVAAAAPAAVVEESIKEVEEEPAKEEEEPAAAVAAAAPATEEATAEPLAPAEVVRVKSELSSVAAPRVTLITITGSDESNTMEVGAPADPASALAVPAPFARSQTTDSHMSVEVTMASDDDEIVDEASESKGSEKPETIEEDAALAEESPAEKEEAETETAEASPEKEAEEAAVAAPASATKKKKFGLSPLKKLSVPKPNMNISKPANLTKQMTMPTMPKKGPTSPRRMTSFSKPKIGLSKPQLSKPKGISMQRLRSKKFGKKEVEAPAASVAVATDTPVVEEETVAGVVAEEDAAKTETATEDPKEEAENDEPVKEETAEEAPKEDAPVAETEDEEKMETVDLAEDKKAEETSEKETTEVTETVANIFEEEAELVATEQVAKTLEEEAAEQPNIIEMLYAKAETCFGDFTNTACGPKASVKIMKAKASFAIGKKLSKEDEEELIKMADDANLTTKPEATEDNAAAKDDSAAKTEDFQMVAKVSVEDAQASPEKTTIGGLMEPITIATERVSSMLQDSLAQNESLKSMRSMAENMSATFEEATKSVSGAVFPVLVDEATKSVSDSVCPVQADEDKAKAVAALDSEKDDRLEKAAESAKKVLEEGAPVAEEEPEAKKKGGLFGRKNKQVKAKKAGKGDKPPTVPKVKPAAASAPTSPKSSKFKRGWFGKKSPKKTSKKDKKKEEEEAAKEEVKEEVAAVASQDAIEDLGVAPLDSQSLNEPQTSLTEDVVAEEKAKPETVVEEPVKAEESTPAAAVEEPKAEVTAAKEETAETPVAEAKVEALAAEEETAVVEEAAPSVEEPKAEETSEEKPKVEESSQ